MGQKKIHLRPFLDALAGFLLLFPCCLHAFVTSHIMGQLGNNMFQVATACALAWDNGSDVFFYEFAPTYVVDHMFSRVKIIPYTPQQVPYEFEWKEPAFTYTPIPYHPNMRIYGYFQSEKYFAHHRPRILSLFAPRADDLTLLESKFGWLADHPETVGIQLRYYKDEDPMSTLYPQYGADFLAKATSLFPSTSLFVVSSNNLDFAKRSFPKGIENVIFLEGEPNYIDMFLLSYCKHNIISNSSFGWWAAWLNENPGKVVVYPKVWWYGSPNPDMCPLSWIPIDAAAD